MDPFAQFTPNPLHDFLEGEWRDLSSTLASPSTFTSAETSRFTPLGATLPDDDGILPYHKGKRRALEPTNDFSDIPEPGENHCVSETTGLDAQSVDDRTAGGNVLEPMTLVNVYSTHSSFCTLYSNPAIECIFFHVRRELMDEYRYVDSAVFTVSVRPIRRPL